MKCHHLHKYFPLDDFHHEEQFGICKDCGAVVWAHGWRWYENISSYEKARGRLNKECEEAYEKRRFYHGSYIISV